MKDEREKPGPKNPFPLDLGELIKINMRGPVPVRELLKEPAVKNLLGLMALYPAFKAKVLDMVDEL